MEKIYDQTTTCKASWIINKILWWDMTIHNCWYYYRFRLNDWTRDYVIRWLEKNNVWYWTWCENISYSFSGWNVPKVWDQMYVIAQYADSWIIEQWKGAFDKNINLPNCSITSDWDPSYEAYLWADKCKVSWKIENIKKTFTDKCWFNLKIEVHNNKDIYFINGREYFYSEKFWALCLWVWEWWFPNLKYSNDWKLLNTYYPNIWDNFYAILDKKDNTVLKYWLDSYNSDNSIPVCNNEYHPENQSMTWWLTQEKIDLVMQAVEKEFLKLDPFHNNFGKWHSIWIMTTVKEKISEPIKPIISTTKQIYTPKKAVIKKENINTSSVAIIDSWTTSNSTQISTWTNEKVITWVIAKSDTNNVVMTWISQEVKKDNSSNINKFEVYWIIIFVWIILYLIYRNLKIKK